MTPTPTSNNVSAIIGARVKGQGNITTSPAKPRIKCPAVMLAHNRTLMVIGRIQELSSSMRNMNGTRPPGVPAGTILETRELTLFLSHTALLK